MCFVKIFPVCEKCIFSFVAETYSIYFATSVSEYYFVHKIIAKILKIFFLYFKILKKLLLELSWAGLLEQVFKFR